jgi:2-oxoisovalerate dehydrogenase E1 component
MTATAPPSDTTTTLSPDSALELLKIMERARQGDRREGILLRQSRGWFQVSGTGHEALAALMLHLRPDDYLFPYYRDRALALARGVTDHDLALPISPSGTPRAAAATCRATTAAGR